MDVSNANRFAAVCGSLADGKKRLPRTGKYCECEEGWHGINCNGERSLESTLHRLVLRGSAVCQTDRACNAMMPEGKGGVCYQQGVVVNENYQMCDVTNRKILDQLKDDKPQVTFSCNAEHEECNFQCRCYPAPPIFTAEEVLRTCSLG